MPGSRADQRQDLTLDDFYTEDDAMSLCLKRARVAAATDLPVLILGESGTGKTLLARAIHNSSARRASPFTCFNGASLSDTLLDSQLFGHERGAFTGADHRVKGKFELADGGTLFIDEIADMSSAAQSKILRAVEYGEFERLGSEELRIADVRLISATNHPLSRLARSESFRHDLFFRVSAMVITIPPLRERLRDLPFLLATEISRAARAQQKDIIGPDKLAAERIFAHHWPGNLRELNRVIHTAVALATENVIDPEVLLLEASAPADEPEPSDEAILPLAEVERRHILSVLKRFGGNKRRAARALDVSRSTLDRKLAALPRRTGPAR